MKISEALEVANDIRNGCRNVGEADAIVALADAIEVMSTAERNLLLGCDPGQHRSCTVQFEDGTSLAFCEVCGMHWPFDKGAKSKRAAWYASVVATEVAKNIALIREHGYCSAASTFGRWQHRSNCMSRKTIGDGGK